MLKPIDTIRIKSKNINPSVFWFKKIFQYLFLIIFLILLLSEIYLQVFRPSAVEFDSELGWKLKSTFNRIYSMSTQKGRKYDALFETNQFGFRTNSAVDVNGKKILVLGDSFTGDAHSSNPKAWFSILANSIEIDNALTKGSVNVWAGGSGGYGTLQELLLAKRINKHFKPDLLVLQFCSNDFIDNHLEWESASILRQLYLRRPYMNGAGNIYHSSNYLAPVYNSYIFRNSRILNLFDGFINSIEYTHFKSYFKKN